MAALLAGSSFRHQPVITWHNPAAAVLPLAQQTLTVQEESLQFSNAALSTQQNFTSAQNIMKLLLRQTRVLYVKRQSNDLKATQPPFY